MTNNKLLVFGCHGAASVAQAIDDYFGNNVGAEAELVRFSSGEIKFALKQSVRGADCWVIQVFNRGLGDDATRQFYEAKVLLRTLKDCHAASFNLAMPYFPNNRQEKQWGREGYLMKMLVDELLTLGVAEIIIFNLHQPATASLFDGRCTHLFASYVIIPRLKERFESFDVICSADIGSAAMAQFYAKRFGCRVAVLYKGSEHTATGREIEHFALAGDVRGRKVLVVDDIADTVGTLEKGINFLIDEEGASQIAISVVHTIGAGDGREKLIRLCQRPEVIGYTTTNTILQPAGFFEGIPNITIVDLNPTIAETIKNIHEHRSVGGVYLVD